MAGTLTHQYAPWGAAKTLFQDRSPEVLLSGPAGTGKSRACLEKLHLLMLVNPGARGLIVRKTQVSLTSTALVTWREHVAKEMLDTGQMEWYGGSAAQPAQYRYQNGSSIAVGGMDKSTKVMSAEYDVIYVQEATELTENDWEALTTRLRNGKVSFQQMIADCNPDTPHHWLKQRADRNAVHLLESRHEDNPILFHDGTPTEVGAAYISKLDALTGVRHARLRRGIWAASEGIVYEEWDPAVHLVDRFEIPRSWQRWWVVDFGFNNPFVCQWWAEDPDGGLWMYREIYQTGKTVAQHAKDILEANGDDPKPRYVITDHAAHERAVLAEELAMGTSLAKKSVIEGIQAVQNRLRSQRLHILRDSLVRRDNTLVDSGKPVCTEQEIVGYIWLVGKGHAAKEEPLKENDHGMDCLRYLVAERDLAARPRVRFLG